MILALSSGVETAWWITLAAGLVVAIVVWGLLELLRRTVDDIDSAVDEVWTMGKRVAGNTQTTHMLGSTKALAVELLEEVGEHKALLEEKGEG